MADAIASVVVEHVVSTIEHLFLKEVKRVSGVSKKIASLSGELNTIRNLLDDAEKKGAAGDKAVGEWLKKLENASYELEDVLDGWYTSLRKAEIKKEVRNCPSFIYIHWHLHKLAVRHDVAKKLENVKENIDSIVAEKDRYGLVPTATPHSSTTNWRGQTTSFVDMTEIHGRDIEREDLVRRVLQAGDQIQILSIVGVGGVGKTTLAKLVHNDSRVEECFGKFRIWISVSDPFDKSLKDCISGKKFLLVMDDVWTEDSSRWKPLITSLKNGIIGSKVLVTTRNERVAKMMGSLEDGIHRLNVLSDEACWSLVQRIAFFGRDGGEWKRYERVAINIANKCKGLPLAAKALGSLLYFKNRLEEWESVLNSEIWKLEGAEDEIFPHLRLSYNELSPRLKRCFSYCAIFPKDTRIRVDELIHHWMALGYLGCIGDMELRGRAYFDQLAMRCLLQDFAKDKLDGKILYCKMHDIVHDFALSLRKNTDDEAGIRNTSKCKVCSPAIISHAKKYRSFGNREPHRSLCDCVANLRVLYLGEFRDQRIPQIKKFIHLKWLDLSCNYLAATDMETICRLYNLQTLLLRECDLKEIPREIGNLILLRHLDLRMNLSLKELPESLCDLHELQILNIENCGAFCRLPQGFHRLENLKHLHNIGCSSLEQFPQEIAQLTGLCTLVEFRAGSGRSKLGLLKNLNRLSGSLTLDLKLSGSENIVDAREGELKKKDGIQRLHIVFDINSRLDGDSQWVNLLDALEPHPNLLMLLMYSYGGSTLPSWMVSPSPLNKLKFILLDDFTELSSLPPLGRLPCLEEIAIYGIYELQVVGPEFLEGSSNSYSSSNIAFPKLKKLTIQDCSNWMEWEDITTTKEEAVTDSCEAISSSVMPCLTELVIKDCDSLTALPHRLLASLSSLEKLNITGSTALEIRYGERQGSAWKSISAVHPRLQLISTFCFDSTRHGMVTTETTSHVEFPQICGQYITAKRDVLVERMVDLTSHHLQILSIVGMQGVGKTTLAQLVYNDSRVRECFELRMWVIPNCYDKVSVAKHIIGSMTKKCPDSEEMEFLLQSIKDCISGKKFLLVVDAVLWDNDAASWEPLITSLKNGSTGSKILVTTREERIAKRMGSLENEVCHIERLPEEDFEGV